jgi:DNA polymerase III alpha subunit
MTDEYAELHAASAFSFLQAASQPESLIERAVELEMGAMALLDHNGVYGAARFHTSAKRNSVRAHTGAEVSISSFGPRLTPNLQESRCSVKHARAIRISASSSRSSRCAKRRKEMVQRLSMISNATLPA